MDSVRPCGDGMLIASWNVQGLSEVKVWEIIHIMKRRRIDILCMQETHISQSPYYNVGGFQVILAGSSTSSKEFAGAGFVVAPWAMASVVGFLQFSNRLSCMKIRVSRGQIAIINGYAPHSGYPFAVRQCFFEKLGDMIRKTSLNGLKLVFGDLNARIQRRMPGEDAFVGEYVFGSTNAGLQLGSNRELMLEVCASECLCVANTFFEHACEEQVTFRSAGVNPMGPVSPGNFAQLDVCLVAQSQLHDVADVKSCRSEALATQHFLVLVEVKCAVSVVRQVKRARLDFR